jgi:hypothetical protein
VPLSGEHERNHTLRNCLASLATGQGRELRSYRGLRGSLRIILRELQTQIADVRIAAVPCILQLSCSTWVLAVHTGWRDLGAKTAAVLARVTAHSLQHQ